MTIFKILTVVLLGITCTHFSHGQAQEKNTYLLVILQQVNSTNSYSEEEIQVMENEHMRHISRLSKDGQLANAGPFEEGGEILVMNTTTRQETEDLLLNDLIIKNGLYKMEILQLIFDYGNVCEAIVPYEMKTYTLVRYMPANQIASYKANMNYKMQEGHKEHLDELIQTGEVIVIGSFTGNDGGIIIYEKDALNTFVQKDPSIVNGYMIAQSKTIWLNKGSFCH